MSCKKILNFNIKRVYGCLSKNFGGGAPKDVVIGGKSNSRKIIGEKGGGSHSGVSPGWPPKAHTHSA